MRRPRRNHSAAFKPLVAMEALRGEETLAELAQRHDVHATQIAAWKSELLQDPVKKIVLFGAGRKSRSAVRCQAKLKQTQLQRVRNSR